jgi:hypothetical protein
VTKYQLHSGQNLDTHANKVDCFLTIFLKSIAMEDLEVLSEFGDLKEIDTLEALEDLDEQVELTNKILA